MTIFYNQIIPEEVILKKTTTILPDGSEQEWVEADLPCSFLEDDEKNVRFGGELLSPEKQKEMLLNESPKEMEALKRNIGIVPTSSEPIMAYLNPGMNKPIKVHGHRRSLAAAEVGLEHVRVLIAIDISEKNRKFLRDNPEANPTKVNHTSFAKARMAHNELKDAKSKEEREEIIESISKRTGHTRAKVLHLEGTSAFMDNLCSNFDVTAESRKSQFKAFESCFKIDNSEFQELRIKGEWDTYEKLEQLMKGFLKLGVAHDDIHVSLQYLAKAKPTDPLLKQVLSNEFNFEDIEDLRKITINVRLAMIKADSPLKELKKACDREWHRTFELQDKEVASDIVAELSLVIKKFESLRDSIA